jgi:hypothetical protein
MYHPERRDNDVAKMGFKTGAGKTSLSLMEVFNIALKCSLQILRTFNCSYMCVYVRHNNQ